MHTNEKDCYAELAAVTTRAEVAEADAAKLRGLLERAIAHVNYKSTLYNVIDAALDQPAGTPDIVTNVGPGKDAR